jgi:hypothetical protein
MLSPSNRHILTTSALVRLGLQAVVSLRPLPPTSLAILTGICHRNLSSWLDAVCALDRWCSEQHDRAHGPDDDGEENGGLFVGSPAQVADGLAEEVRGDHRVLCEEVVPKTEVPMLMRMSGCQAVRMKVRRIVLRLVERDGTEEVLRVVLAELEMSWHQ